MVRVQVLAASLNFLPSPADESSALTSIPAISGAAAHSSSESVEDCSALNSVLFGEHSSEKFSA